MTAAIAARGEWRASSTTSRAKRCWRSWSRPIGSRHGSRTDPIAHCSCAWRFRKAPSSLPKSPSAPGAAGPDCLVLGGDDRQLLATAGRFYQGVDPAHRPGQRLLDGRLIAEMAEEKRRESIAGAARA